MNSVKNSLQAIGGQITGASNYGDEQSFDFDAMFAACLQIIEAPAVWPFPPEWPYDERTHSDSSIQTLCLFGLEC